MKTDFIAKQASGRHYKNRFFPVQIHRTRKRAAFWCLRAFVNWGFLRKDRQLMKQLMIPLPGINRHHYSPFFIEFWDACFDFECELDARIKFLYTEEREGYNWEDEKITIGVPAKIEDQSAVPREELELWTARLREAIFLMKCGKMDMFFLIPEAIV